MSITTDQDAVVIYSMNSDDVLEAYTGEKPKKRFGICFETQAPPIGRNMCFIEASLLDKGEKYIQKTIYKFFVS